MKNHYQILLISPSATQEQIKTAYTDAILKIQGTLNFALAFAELREAYDTLSDPKLRKIYDIQLGLSFESKSNKEYLQDGNFIRSNLSSLIILFYRSSFLKKIIDFIINPFLNPFRQLNQGYYRLFLAGWILVPFFIGGFTYILAVTGYKADYYSSSSSKAIDVYLFLVFAYYPIARISLWVWNGFKDDNL